MKQLFVPGSDPVPVPDPLKVVGDDDVIESGHGCFRVLSEKSGDDRVVWDSASLADINAARDLFAELVSKGLTPYKVGTDGKATSEVMKEFDATAEEVIFLPTKVLVGG